MIRRIFDILSLSAFIFFVTLMVLAIPSFYEPEFEIINKSYEAVSVMAKWRGNEKNIGILEPMSSYQFNVNDEAPMTFKVGYESGKKVESTPLYFTRGTRVIATIFVDDLEVRYDHETE